jgi:membrane associated rhomboid family serine protease
MRNTLWQDFRMYVLHSGNVLYKLVAINVAVFLLMAFVSVFLTLFGVAPDLPTAMAVLQAPLSVHSGFPDMFIYAWAFITYQFVHHDFFHILFNMLIFLFAGRIFREFLGDKKLLSVYLLGGVCGAIVFILAMQAFPIFRGSSPYMMGASASVMAVLAGIGTLLPTYSVRLMFIGNVKLVYIVIFLAVVDFISLVGANAGGHFAHLGGVAWGFLYIRNLQQGRDLGAWLTNLFDRLKPGQKRSTLRARRSDGATLKPVSKSSANRVSQDEVDTILDKIAKSGYESLSQREKDILFRASKEE